jgi:hypothetical protein
VCRYAKLRGFDNQLATVRDERASLVRGRSRTTVEARLSERTTGRFSINVHEQNFPFTDVACGDIPKAAP